MSEFTTEENIEANDLEDLSNIVSELPSEPEAEEEVEEISDTNISYESASGSDPALLAKIEALENKNAQLIRVAADFENYKRRQAKEKEDLIKFAGSKVVTNMLPAIDNFERALSKPPTPEELQGFYEGVQMIHKQLLDVLQKSGVTVLDTEGQLFNPEFHEAVMTEPNDDFPDQTVLEEFQKGYIMNGRLLRPAMVKVSQSS